MNLYPNNPDEQIAAALRRLARTQPPADLEQRVRTRLQDKSARPKNSRVKFADFFFGQRIVFASAAVALACVAIVVGSVQHSRQSTFPDTGVHLSGPDSGLGAASSTHISPQPIIAPEHAHARSERKAAGGRATVPKDAHKPKGVAVPDSVAPERP
jgi:hypothetical protein